MSRGSEEIELELLIKQFKQQLIVRESCQFCCVMACPSAHEALPVCMQSACCVFSCAESLPTMCWCTHNASCMLLLQQEVQRRMLPSCVQTNSG